MLFLPFGSKKNMYQQIFYPVELYLVTQYAETQNNFMKNKNFEYFHKNCTIKTLYFSKIQNSINIVNIETENVDF